MFLVFKQLWCVKYSGNNITKVEKTDTTQKQSSKKEESVSLIK